MKKFNRDTKCIKCGYDWDDVWFNPPYTEYKVGIFNTEKQENWFDNICDCNKEYLMRTCCRCEYKWVEKCIPVEEKIETSTIEIEGELKKCDKDMHFLDYPTSSQDKLAGDKAADVIGDTNIHCKYQKPIDQWTKIMKALRIHGFKISFK